MLLLLLSFVFGLILTPVLYACIPCYFRMANHKKFFGDLKIDRSLSDELKKELKNSMAENGDLSWFNVAIQRIFHDMTKNYYFESKVKHLLMKSFESSVGNKLIKSVQIKKICFGNEAPFLKHIRLITKEEYQALTEDGSKDLKSFANLYYDDLRSDPRGQDVPKACIYNSNKIDFGSLNSLNDMSEGSNTDLSDIAAFSGPINREEEMLDADFDKFTTNHRKTYGQEKILENLKPNEIGKSAPFCSKNDGLKEEDSKFTDVFSKTTFFGNLVYNGKFKVLFEVELVKGTVVSLYIVLNKLNSDFILRLPAENYSTRFEFTLIRSPVADIKVESVLETKTSKLLFKNMLSSFFRRSVQNIFKGMFIYPNWYQFTMPFVGSSRSLDLHLKYFEALNYNMAFENCELIMKTVGYDFKITTQKDGILYKRSCFVLNNKNFVYSWAFNIPKQFSFGDANFVGDFRAAENSESKSFLTLFEDLKILKNVITGFAGITVIDQTSNSTRIMIQVNDTKHDFVRVFYKNMQVFYRNDPKACEFFVFKFQDNVLTVYGFSDLFEVYFNNKRISRLKKQVSRINNLNDDLKQTNSTSTADVSEENEVTLERKTNLEDLFKDALNLEHGEFRKHSLKVHLQPGRLLEALRDDSLRMKLVSENSKISNVLNQTEVIKTITFTRADKSEAQVCSFHDRKFIIDIFDNNQSIIIYRIRNLKDKKASHSKLEIVHRTKNEISFPNFFVESIKIRESVEAYLSEMESMSYLADSSPFVKEIKTVAGTLFFEFRADLQDLFQLRIFSCKKQKTIFKANKIVSSRTFRMVHPVENDFIKISLKPKYNKNAIIEYKMNNFTWENSFFIDGSMELCCNHKFRAEIKGHPSHYIFWEKDVDSNLESFVKNKEDENKIRIENFGLLRPEEKDYVLVHKNLESSPRPIKIFVGMLPLH